MPDLADATHEERRFGRTAATGGGPTGGRLSELQWRTLVREIKEGRCTPFLGAGAAYPRLPLGGELARRWATSPDFAVYPFPDATNLRELPSIVGSKPRIGCSCKARYVIF